MTAKAIKLATGRIELRLDPDEAKAVKAVLGRVDGCEDRSPRRHTGAVFWALSEAGVDHRGFGRLLAGSARFDDDVDPPEPVFELPAIDDHVGVFSGETGRRLDRDRKVAAIDAELDAVRLRGDSRWFSFSEYGDYRLGTSYLTMEG